MASNLRFVKSLKRSTLAAVLGVCFAGAVVAAETGGLRITITGEDGQPLAGATVSVSSPDSLVSKSGVTEADGSVRLTGLDPATNYTVQVQASGYADFTSAANVAVVSGQNLSVGYALGVTALDTVTVTGAALAAIDTTSAQVGTTLNLDIVESLPTGRSYQSYLQLVPGVKPSPTGNPSSKSGVNYSDIGGAVGASSDNLYYLDGVDVTDPLSGTFGAHFNSEIIQEQQVITGGVPAEYAGGSGLISKVVTKSGSDEYHGSINYYLQNDSLVADDEHGESAGFSTFDTAVTLGGPIVKEKLWFFGSYQLKGREDDVLNPVTGEALRTVSTDQDLAFFKATWQMTYNDRLTATFFNDPFERDGSLTATTLNNRDFGRDQGGDNYKIEYTHDWTDLRLNAYAFGHEGEVSNIAAENATRNDVAFLSGSPTNADLQLGGSGSNIETFRNKDELGLSLEYWLDTAWGSHAFKFGYSQSENTYKENQVFTGPEAAQYTSIALADIGTTFEELTTLDWTGSVRLAVADIGRIQDVAVGTVMDANNDGIVTVAEVNAYQFTSTAGNPGGAVNAYRIVQSVIAPYKVTSEGATFYLQDTWTLDQWTVNAGIRAEEWAHFASDGSEVFTFDWEIAPRLSVVYDLTGDGRSKVWGFYGRYYDPVRNNMTDFAGNLTGSVLDEQIFIGDEWITFRTRGGPQTPDALFAPSTKTPYTDEFLLGYATTFGADMSLSVTYTNRKTRDILEDYDLALYADPNGDTSTGHANADSFFYLPLSYFGYDTVPNSNYVIATLAGGKRDYQGVEVTLHKQWSNNWQGMVSYTFNDAEGNTNSDSNADFQGDWIALDPRAPNAYGTQPGNIEHQFKAWGSYSFGFGLDLSGVFNWNSGVVYSRTALISARHLPVMDAPYEFGGVTDSYISADAIGSEEGPAYYTLDVRAKYTHALPVGEIEVFLDIFNILDNQAAIAEQDLVAGDGVYDFGEANEWVEPRQFYLGARYSF